MLRLTNIPPRQIRELGIGTFFYAGLFFTEGFGLWLLKPWAEWLTVIATGSLVPLEFYEIFRRPTLIRIALLVVNVAIVAYVIYRIRLERHTDRS